ncbi:MAG: hypothetical protein CVU80_02735, partial [Elusimicrobia bacterium HGW-Elusimicrobia-4]
MKLLIVSGSPLKKIGQDYYAVDSWIRIPLYLADRCEVTLWSPVETDPEEEGLHHSSWRVELGSLKIEHHDSYNSFLKHYQLWPRRAISWRKHADQLVKAHDAVIIRHPSPMISIVSRSTFRQGKPLIILVMSDLSRTDRILGNHGLRRMFYTALAKLLVLQEIRSAMHADVVGAYSSVLAYRHRGSRGLVKLMQDPVLHQDEFVFRNDTCQSQEVRILRVSWVQPLKGLEYLLEAVAILLAKGIEVRLEIVGKERSQGYQAKIEDLAEELGIADNVIFTGWVPFDQMQEVYMRSDIQVISSLAEGTPRCIAEGAARGLPLVSTMIGGCADVLTHEVDALLVAPADAVALAGAIERVIRDGTLRRNMIRQGY